MASKKLTGNGMWESSRMMLTDHREQYLERRAGAVREDAAECARRAAVAAGDVAAAQGAFNVLSADEVRLVRDYALLPIVMSIAENNRGQLERSGYALRAIYIRMTNHLLDSIHADLMLVRKTMKQHNLRIFDEQHHEDGIQFRFTCRGYEDKFVMTRDVIRAEASRRLEHYARVNLIAN